MAPPPIRWVEFVDLVGEITAEGERLMRADGPLTPEKAAHCAKLRQLRRETALLNQARLRMVYLINYWNEDSPRQRRLERELLAELALDEQPLEAA